VATAPSLPVAKTLIHDQRLVIDNQNGSFCAAFWNSVYVQTLPQKHRSTHTLA
jgi:hypothetical protein